MADNICLSTPWNAACSNRYQVMLYEQILLMANYPSYVFFLTFYIKYLNVNETRADSHFSLNCFIINFV